MRASSSTTRTRCPALLIRAAATRLNVPVYLDDRHASDEWWRLMGDDLDSARMSDRSVFSRAITDDLEPLNDEDANALLRVLNEARLVLGARMGVEVEEDHDHAPRMDRDRSPVIACLLGR